MVKILERVKDEIPDPVPGMAFSVIPHHQRYWDSPFYYNQMGKDPLAANKIWPIADANERVEKLKGILDDYPSVFQRREMMFAAARDNDEAILRALVETGASPHPKMESRVPHPMNPPEAEMDSDDVDEENLFCNPLHIAATRGHLGCVKILIEDGGVDVDAKDDENDTPLIGACIKGHIDVLKYLLGKGASPLAGIQENETNDDDKDDNGDNDDNDNDSDNDDNDDEGNDDDNDDEGNDDERVEYSPLECAVSSGKMEIVKLILEHPFHGSTRKRKYQADKQEVVQITPEAIQRAAYTRNIELLKFLLERAMYPIEDKDGVTKGDLLNEEQKETINNAIKRAALFADLESFKFLLSYQFPTDGNGNLLPFDLPDDLKRDFVNGAYTCADNDDVEKFKFLFSFNLEEWESKSLDNTGDRPLNIQHVVDECAQEGSLNLVKHLIENHDADPNFVRMPPGTSTLRCASLYNQGEVVRYLLENTNADIHLGDGRYSTGPTALWNTMVVHADKTAELLLKHGGPVDEVDSKIKRINGPMKVVLVGEQTDRAPIRLLTIESAKKKYAESDMPTQFMLLEIDVGDWRWIQALEPRKSNEELREYGERARELNEDEAEKNLKEDDYRNLAGHWSTPQDLMQAVEEELDGGPSSIYWTTDSSIKSWINKLKD